MVTYDANLTPALSTLSLSADHVLLDLDDVVGRRCVKKYKS